MEVLEEEVAEKKSEEIFVRVAKACSIGAQMTLIMGGGALLFRYGCQARHLQIARIPPNRAAVRLVCTLVP